MLLRCSALRCAALFCAAPCCAVLSCVELCCAAVCGAVPCVVCVQAVRVEEVEESAVRKASGESSSHYSASLPCLRPSLHPACGCRHGTDCAVRQTRSDCWTWRRVWRTPRGRQDVPCKVSGCSALRCTALLCDRARARRAGEEEAVFDTKKNWSAGGLFEWERLLKVCGRSLQPMREAMERLALLETVWMNESKAGPKVLAMSDTGRGWSEAFAVRAALLKRAGRGAGSIGELVGEGRPFRQTPNLVAIFS